MTGDRAAAQRAQPEPARRARAGGLRHRHARRPRRRRPGGGRDARPRARAPPVEPRGRAGRRHPRRPRPLRRHRHQRRCPHPLRLVAARRAGRLRRPDRRAPPVEPGRPRAVAPHLGDRARRDGDHRRLRRPRLPAGRSRRWRGCWRDGAPGHGRRRPGRPAPRRRSTRPACDALLVTHLTNIRYLTGFTGSAALLLVRPDDADLRHRRPLRGAGGRASSRAGGRRRRRRDRSHRRRAARGSSTGWRRASPASGLEADHVTWAAQRRYADEWFPAVRAGPRQRPRRGAAPREGRRRGRPHRGRRGIADARPGRGRAAARRRPHRGGVRPRARHRDAPPRRRRPVLRDDRRLRPQRRPAPPPPVGPAASSAATSSSSTSAPSSTATTPT